MADKRTFRLVHHQARERAVKCVWEAPDGNIVTVQEQTRNLEQNALLHAALTEISKQMEWCGKKLDIDVWKRLCMASWLREKGEAPMLVPALDGNGFDVVFERTSKLSKTQCSELLEWCFAFGAEHGVQFG